MSVSSHAGQWKACSPRRVPPGSSAESWHLSGSWLELQRQPVPRARGQEQHSKGEPQPGYVYFSCRKLFLAKAAHFNISKCNLWTSSLERCLTCRVKQKGWSPILRTWWDNRCLPSKQEGRRCRRVLKLDLTDFIWGHNFKSKPNRCHVFPTVILLKDCFHSFWNEMGFAWFLTFEFPICLKIILLKIKLL